MNERFLQYTRVKGISLNKLSDLSCVSSSTISRFCKGANISSDNLLRLLQVCDDLSLEWLFFGSGEMIRRPKQNNTYNFGVLAGAEVTGGDSIKVKNASGVQVGSYSTHDLEAILTEKNRVIAQKDKVISERDATIRELLDRLTARQ